MRDRPMLVRALSLGATLALPITLPIVPGCYRHHDPCSPPPPETRDVDLLFVIDDSADMVEEHAALAAELPRIVGSLASGDLDHDGLSDFDPVASLHVGVITTDMGSAGHPVPGCDSGALGARFGDDGLLSTAGDPARAGCMATYPAVFELGREGPPALVRDLACVTSAGTSGCSVTQPLEAVLKALSPSSPRASTVPDYVPPTFLDGTTGHGDRENAGFLRDGSVLAIVVLTTDEDCSVRSPSFFDDASAPYGDVALGVRCSAFPDALHSIERYVRGTDGRSGLLGLRRRAGRIAFFPIVGVPPSAMPESAVIDFDAVLAHPDMEQRVDPTDETRLAPSCNVPGVGESVPPRRLVELTRSLAAAGVHTAITSICQGSFGAAILPILDAVDDPAPAPEECTE